MVDQLRNWLKESIINKWIGILTFCFGIQSILEVVGWSLNIPFEQGILNLFGLKNELSWKIHSLFTYGFIHNGFFHFIFNVFTLFFSAQMLQTFWRPKQVIHLFIFGIISGGIHFLLGTILISEPSLVVGASAGVFSLLFAATRFSPNMPVYLFGIFRIPLWLISAGLLLLSISGLNSSNSGGEWAHIGGGILGLILAKRPDFVNELNLSIKSIFKTKSKIYIDRNEPETSFDRAQHLDMILDKIGKVGYEKLTAKEKTFLKKYGEK